MESYSAIKSKIMSSSRRWILLEIILGEISQIHKDKYGMISVICEP